MKLKQLLNEMNYQVLQGDLNQEVSQIDYDSRTVQDRSLFVCIPGANVDGHDFIDQVINRGARVIVVEHDVPFQEGITYIRVKEARLALALLSCAFFEHPSRQMTVIGITGTKGKNHNILYDGIDFRKSEQKSWYYWNNRFNCEWRVPKNQKHNSRIF